jgi:hypothetical protein
MGRVRGQPTEPSVCGLRADGYLVLGRPLAERVKRERELTAQVRDAQDGISDQTAV